MGVRFRLNVEIGRDIAFEQLLADYDAVFLGTGAYTFVDGELPGRELDGVHDALPFLIANANRLLDDQPVPPALDLNGKHVVVLGGGDTGMDCNRTSIRLGAASVTCVYRRDEASMPGSRREVGYSREEGVQLPVPAPAAGFVGRTGQGARRAPDPYRGGYRHAWPHAAATRRGQRDRVARRRGDRRRSASVRARRRGAPNTASRWMPAAASWPVAKARLPFQTGHPKIFAGGDNMRGADLVVRAVHDGREAAKSIAQMLSELPLEAVACVA